MDIKEIDLKKLKLPLEKALSAYSVRTGLEFKDCSDFSLTSEKPYSARTDISVFYDNKNQGKLCVIAFVKGDGTGNEDTFDSNTYANFKFSDEYNNKDKQANAVPRAKNGVICEGFFPLFSITPKKETRMFSASLDELTVETGEIKLLRKLGQNNHDYEKSINGSNNNNPKIYLTVGDFSGIRIGDPHSVFYAYNTADALQVAGFLAITESNKSLLNISKKWGNRP